MFDLPSKDDVTEFIVDQTYAEDKIRKSSKLKLLAA
jgi:hypothetical protein